MCVRVYVKSPPDVNTKLKTKSRGRSLSAWAAAHTTAAPPRVTEGASGTLASSSALLPLAHMSKVVKALASWQLKLDHKIDIKEVKDESLSRYWRWREEMRAIRHAGGSASRGMDIVSVD